MPNHTVKLTKCEQLSKCNRALTYFTGEFGTIYKYIKKKTTEIIVNYPHVQWYTNGELATKTTHVQWSTTLKKQVKN